MATFMYTPDGGEIELNETNLVRLKEDIDGIDDTNTNDEAASDNYKEDAWYAMRLATYMENWPLDFLTPQDMTKAGFYFLNQNDLVRCAHCYLELSSWEPGDNPITKHKEKSPNCPFFKRNHVCNHHHHHHDHDRETARVTEPMNLSNETLSILKSSRIFHRIVVKITTFATVDARLNTFENAELTQSIESLSDAGFYYIVEHNSAENGDKCICYACTLGLDHWNANDDPWKEHAKFSLNCSHMLLKKGHHFINVSKLTNNQQTASLQLANDRGDDSNPEDGITMSIENKLVEPEKEDDNRENVSLYGEYYYLYQERDLKTIPTCMLCKICYKRAMDVCVLPCGHIFACVDCAVTMEQCGICRLRYTTVIKVSMYFTEAKHDDGAAQTTSGSLKDLEETNSSANEKTCCKRCNISEMEALFLPCRHIYTCLKCARKFEKCPVCSTSICAYIKIYTS